MLEKLLLKELRKRIKHRFKLRGMAFNKKEAKEHEKIITREIVDKILDDLINRVEGSRGWWCDSCKNFVPGNEVHLDQDTYLHVPPKGDCRGDCHTHLYSDRDRLIRRTA